MGGGCSSIVVTARGHSETSLLRTRLLCHGLIQDFSNILPTRCAPMVCSATLADSLHEETGAVCICICVYLYMQISLRQISTPPLPKLGWDSLGDVVSIWGKHHGCMHIEMYIGYTTCDIQYKIERARHILQCGNRGNGSAFVAEPLTIVCNVIHSIIFI